MTEHRPWFASYPKGIPRSLEPYPEVSVFSMLEGAARRFPDRPATAWFGAHLSYAELLRAAERFSAVLDGMDVVKGDRVAFILPNSPQFVIAFYGAVRLGAIAVGNNPLYTQREMEHQLSDSGAKVVVCLDSLYPNFAPVFARLKIENVIVMAGVPARQIGWMSRHGERLDIPVTGSGSAACRATGERYRMRDGALTLEGTDGSDG